MYLDIFKLQLVVSGHGFCPHVFSESSMPIHHFFNPHSIVEIFEYAMNPELCGR